MINPRGIQLRSLRLRGEDKNEAKIDFVAGLNVISGVSDTGKSYILQCINYVFGSSDPPKQIDEAKGYQRIYLECVDSQGKIFTLCRYLNDKTIIKYESNIDHISQVNPETFGRDGGAGGNLSPFLLRKCGLDEVDIVKNARGETQRFSFRTIANWICVDEEAIISERSPFLSLQTTSHTSDTNGFNYLITGNIIQVAEVAEKREITQAKIDAQQNLLDKLIAEIQDAINNEIEDQANETNGEAKVIFDFAEIKKRIEQQNRLINELQFQLRNYCSELAERKAEYREIIIGVERLKLLDATYNKDIERLDFILDGSHFYDQIKDTECPFCLRKGDITDKAIPFQHDMLTESCLAEREAITRKMNELSQTIDILMKQGNDLNSIILALHGKKQSLEHQIATELVPSLDELQNKFDEGMSMIQATISKDELEKQRIKLITQKIALDNIPKKSNEKISFGINSQAMQYVCDCIRDVLKRWQFPNHGTVAFDPTTRVRDITIGGKKRSDYGKGYRAVSKTAFWVGVMEYCAKNNLAFPYFLIFDSPLLNVKQHADDESINDEVKQAFFDDMANLPLTCQVIVLENVEPPESVRSRCNCIMYTKDNNGLGGFIPQ